MPLTEQRKQQLDLIVQQMTQNKESSANIQTVVDDFKSKYENESAPVQAAPPAKRSSIGSVLKNVAIGAGKGVASTVKGGVSLVGKGLEAIAPAPKRGPTVTQDIESLVPKAKLEPQGLPQRIGFAGERVAEFLLPSPKIAAVTKGAKLLTRAVTEGAIAGTQRAAQTGEFGKEAKTFAAFGAAAPIAGAAIKPVASYLASRFPKLLGIFTGEGDDVIRAALKNPTVADAGISKGDQALRSAVQTAADRSVQVRDNFIKAHADVFGKLVGEDSKALVKRTVVRADFENLLKQNGVTVNKGQLDFAISRIKANPGEVSKVQAAYEAVTKWNDFSLRGLNTLKQLIGQLTKFADDAGKPSKSPTLGKAYNLINETIKHQLPAEKRAIYTQLNAKFSNTIDVLDDMVDAFNKGDPFTRIANLFSKNKDTLRQIVIYYEKQTGDAISPIVAGRELAMEKTAAFGFLNPRSWIDFLISPQTQAKVVTKAGKGLQALLKRKPSSIGQRIFGGNVKDLEDVPIGLGIRRVGDKIKLVKPLNLKRAIQEAKPKFKINYYNKPVKINRYTP